MGVYAEKPQKEYVLVEPGTYVARCVSIIEIGTYDAEFNGKTSRVHKALVGWELPTELAVFDKEKGEQPHMVSKEYNLTLHEKSNLRKDLEAWRGVPFTDEEAAKFDISKLLGKECMVTIVHKPKMSDPKSKSVKVDGVGKMMRGLVCPTQVNPSKMLCFDNFDWALFGSLPDWLKTRIQESDEYQKLEVPADMKSEFPTNPLIDKDPAGLPF